MQTFDFDQTIDRRASESIKWHAFADEVLPMWVADMDFTSPPAIIEALHQRVSHGVFGYPAELEGLKEAILDWLERRYAWKVKAEDLIFLPGVVVGFNLVAQALCTDQRGVVIQTPVYPPFLNVGKNAGVPLLTSKLTPGDANHYEVDFDSFSNSLDQNAGMFLLCNPHNPVGRVFTRKELEQMAEQCLRRGVLICSDEIHCDLVYEGYHHVPLASLDAEIASKTVTLMAPSKTFNIPGLEFSFAVVSDPQMRQKINQARRGLVGGVNLMGMVAARAAYQQGECWLEQLLAYLKTNRDWLYQTVRECLPEVKMPLPEGTYLAWLDFRQTEVGNDPFSFFLKEAKVGLNDGRAFGNGGEGHVRLNFGCPLRLLQEGVNRMIAAFERTQRG
ncbi:MAG: PatB family C-S lyase [Bellilinea sp.]|nr:PatB family C-S lyase [Bellilinea sp.]